jgi:hypothetical protein
MPSVSEMEAASNGQIHHHNEQPRPVKLIIDTDPGVGAYGPSPFLPASSWLTRCNCKLAGRRAVVGHVC